MDVNGRSVFVVKQMTAMTKGATYLTGANDLAIGSHY
jgi:hypothetical protein